MTRHFFFNLNVLFNLRLQFCVLTGVPSPAGSQRPAYSAQPVSLNLMQFTDPSPSNQGGTSPPKTPSPASVAAAEAWAFTISSGVILPHCSEMLWLKGKETSECFHRRKCGQETVAARIWGQKLRKCSGNTRRRSKVNNNCMWLHV